MGHPCAFGGPGIPAIKLGDLLAVRVPRVAVERGEFSDQLGNGQTEFGRSGLELVGREFVDLDADVAAHGTRIADPGDRLRRNSWDGDCGRFDSSAWSAPVSKMSPQLR
jgi:hypothetical protein